eukprot:TRINITY_DN80474_c0_g1_i1.p1 TRINITY_DN80474_c0_g1~~TRINITY_DN80474_c0_g1_i1.p1  ORF type:complete len:820 (+),score=223.24 TRINITY_DN80474_c0_g1_i1:129-2588(+)
MCEHILRVPNVPRDCRIFKDECALCFSTPESEGGLDVCLSCYCGSCVADHTFVHYAMTEHPLVLRLCRRRKHTETDGTEDDAVKGKSIPALDKLIIPAETDEDKYETLHSVVCLECGIQVGPEEYSDTLHAVVQSVLEVPSALKRQEIVQWERDACVLECPHCKDLPQLVDFPPIPSRDDMKCRACELKDNLWMCLICGSFGCGRKNWDGTGGNGHGLSHFEETGHPVCVNIGTLTPEGKADIYCYTCNDEVKDPMLKDHLEHFGINLEEQEKTEQSLAERELERNLTFDFSKVTEDGEELIPLYGSGFTGLENLGNSCYMASVLQVLFSIPQFQMRFYPNHEIAISPEDIPRAFQSIDAQWAKVAYGLLSGDYSVKPKEFHGVGSGDPESGTEKRIGSEDRVGIKPRMFKYVTCADHPDFVTFQQQDAFEYLTFALGQIDMQERAKKQLFQSPSNVFKFNVEHFVRCTSCGCVRYNRDVAPNSILPVDLPLEIRVNASSSSSTSASAGEEACKDGVADFQDMLASTFIGSSVDGFVCPACSHNGEKRVVQTGMRMVTFPDVLVIQVKRFVFGSDYVPKKLMTSLHGCDSLDLSMFRGTGLQEGEVAMPDDGQHHDAGSGANEKEVLPFDESVVDGLMEMGFDRPRCVLASQATHASGMGIEAAMEWLMLRMEHTAEEMEQELGISRAGNESDPFSAETVSLLCGMGFSEEQAKAGLRQTSGDPDRAVEWLLSHPDFDPSLEQEGSANEPTISDGEGDYELFAIISHIGKSTSSGHYVAHILKNVDGEEQFVLFNDAKVAVSKKPPKEFGYLYFYRRKN